jgi:spermidine/putrescine transport system substrate-binding protein
MSNQSPDEPKHDWEQLDTALVRGLVEPRLSRAQFLRRAGAGAAGLTLSGLLAACGVSGNKGSAQQGRDWSAWWRKQTKKGVLDFANWPLYIDVSHGKHPSLDQFSRATGIKVNYSEPIQDNESFYAKVSPTLRAGQSIGYDIIVVTNGWQLTEYMNNGWLIPLDHSRLPNFFKYASPLVKDPHYDPGNKYSVAWQSGFTGIGYNPKLTKREITSVHDLWDPAFKGHVGMMSDNTELGSLGMLALGIDPATSTSADWNKAGTLLRKQRDQGLVRQYYDQSYIKALESGDTWITQAWSGDIFQANASGHSDLKFVVPKEGIMHWTDNMIIPMKAAHPVDAIDWMNFYYQPKIAAEVADWVNYITPVSDAKTILEKQDPSVGSSPLVFPTAQMNAAAHSYYVYKDYADYNHWNSIFNPIIQS